MSQKIKCRQCGNIVLKSSAIEMKTRCYVCSNQCKLDYEYEHKPKEPTLKLVSPMRQLTDYVQTYAPDTDWIRFVAQTKAMIKEYNVTISGIQYTLWYMHEHQGVAFTGDGLSLVPYWYSKAQKYYNWLQSIKQQVGAWDIREDKIEIVNKKEYVEDIFN